MLDEGFCVLPLFRVVECTVSVHAVGTVLQKRVTQHVKGVIVLVIPDQRNGLPVVILKRIFQDGSSVGAFQVISGSPAAKVIL